MPRKSRTRPRTTVTLKRELHNLVAQEASIRDLYTQEHLDNIVALHYGLPMPHSIDKEEPQ